MKKAANPCGTEVCGQWTGPGLNRRHQDFQSCALPTELPVRKNAAADAKRQPRQTRLSTDLVLSFRQAAFKGAGEGFAEDAESRAGVSARMNHWAVERSPSA